jgi:hypothetical protein
MLLASMLIDSLGRAGRALLSLARILPNKRDIGIGSGRRFFPAPAGRSAKATIVADRSAKATVDAESSCVSPLKKVAKCSQRPKTVADDLRNRQHGHREDRARNTPHPEEALPWCVIVEVDRVPYLGPKG